MKRRFAFLLALSLIIGLAGGCGRLVDSNKAGNYNPKESQSGSLNMGANNLTDPNGFQNPNGESNSAQNAPNSSPGGEDGADSSPGTPAPQAQASSMPSGVYWATYTVITLPPNSPDEIILEGPYYVGYVEVGEMSTEHLLTQANFSGNQTLVTTTNPNDGSKYWIERIQDSRGATTGLKVGSTAANDFFLNMRLHVMDGTPALYLSGLRSDSGVHAPDGAVLSDPYSDPDRPIAGCKLLHFKCSHGQGKDILNEFISAGYDAFSPGYGNGYYEIQFTEQLTGRALVEKTLLENLRWKKEDELTKGNVGYYTKTDSFTGKVTLKYTYLDVPLVVEINDARLEMVDDGQDETNYTFSGVAKLQQTSFQLGDATFTLKDKQDKPFSDEYGFKVLKDPSPAVRWSYVETWNFVDSFGTPFPVTVTFETKNSASRFDDVPVEDVDDLDGSYTMSYMKPAFSTSATWDFEPENKKQ